MEDNTEATQSSYETRQEEEPEGFVERIYFAAWQNVQRIVDRYAIYPKSRWLVTGLLFLIYVYRAYINQGRELHLRILIGFHIISYFLGLYMLDKFLGFISPKEEEDVMSNSSVLPIYENDEFRPFRRAVKELDLW